MQSASCSGMRARLVYRLILVMVIGGSGLMRTWISRAPVGEYWRPAIYRYPADGMPDCARLTGRMPVGPVPYGVWARIKLPDMPQQSPTACLLRQRHYV